MIDFTKTRTGKPIPKPKQNSPASFVGGFLDFTQNSSQPISSSVSNPIETPNTFGFLNDFAQSAANEQNPQDVTSRLGSTDSEVNALKLKVEDLEYKIERLLERLAEMEVKVAKD